MDRQAPDLQAMTRTVAEAGSPAAAWALAELVLQSFVLPSLAWAEDSAPALEVAPPMVRPECLAPARYRGAESWFAQKLMIAVLKHSRLACQMRSK